MRSWHLVVHLKPLHGIYFEQKVNQKGDGRFYQIELEVDGDFLLGSLNWEDWRPIPSIWPFQFRNRVKLHMLRVWGSPVLTAGLASKFRAFSSRLIFITFRSVSYRFLWNLIEIEQKMLGNSGNFTNFCNLLLSDQFGQFFVIFAIWRLYQPGKWITWKLGFRTNFVFMQLFPKGSEFEHFPIRKIR